MKWQVLAILALTVLVLVACASSPEASIQIAEPWARQSMAPASMGGPQAASAMPATSNGAVYMVIRNNGGELDQLIKASSTVAATVELHTVEKEGDVMKMRPVERIDVPGRGEATLQPGGFHIMLIGLNQPLKPGQKFTVQLTFAKAGEKQVEVMVKEN